MKVTQLSDEILKVEFGFNRKLIEEIKVLEMARWNPEDKCWTVANSEHNLVNLAYLKGQNVFWRYDVPLGIYVPSWRKLYRHQEEMVMHGLTRHYCLIAGEMGTGKSLAAFEIMERSGFDDWWWVAPKSAIYAVQADLRKWKCKVMPQFFTYEALDKLANFERFPKGIIFDESQKIKTPGTKRTNAAMKIASFIRKTYKDDGFVIAMSGSPAPKSPSDWWSQCEVVFPGFLKEGNIHKFNNRLAVVERKENIITGGNYSKLKTWKDNPNKCNICGELADHSCHSLLAEDGFTITGHKFEKSVNEVEKLHQRLKGFVLVQFKKDCLDLPDKIFREVVCTPHESTLRAARMLQVGGGSAIQILTWMRELSDGFLYKDTYGPKVKCKTCDGNRAINEVTCNTCDGMGYTQEVKRDQEQFTNPKDDAVLDLLDDCDDVGRIILYAGFTASIDRLTELVTKAGWEYIRVDGRGWKDSFHARNPQEMLQMFQSNWEKKIAFIGHPASAGTGLTLTASPMAVYYSNSFNGDDRIQSMDRGHRIGMDVNRGFTIVDLIHLPTDRLIINNLKAKRDLQNITLGEVKEAMDAAPSNPTR